MKTSDIRWLHLSRAVMIAGLATVALLFSGCGSSTDGSAATTTSSGATMNVLHAAAQPEGTVVTVQGFLIDDSGTLYISELIAESFPPQPGGAAMEVEGVVLDEFDGVAEEGPVRWRDEPATITATVKSGKLVDAQPAEG